MWVCSSAHGPKRQRKASLSDLVVRLAELAAALAHLVMNCQSSCAILHVFTETRHGLGSQKSARTRDHSPPHTDWLDALDHAVCWTRPCAAALGCPRGRSAPARNGEATRSCEAAPPSHSHSCALAKLCTWTKRKPSLHSSGAVRSSAGTRTPSRRARGVLSVLRLSSVPRTFAHKSRTSVQAVQAVQATP